ncbi:unnamed protein product [Dovyalis caffra]|uniref:Uncharacterized protein n=1 Tax=Dovyalis caffra TaxID=77055 RepID=A0AAV1R7F6_9ROSI|nr:unnamed protein product [Dovyalis caffra]
MVCGTAARPWSGSRLNKDVNVGETEGLIGGFSIQSVKKSGPSPGIGHKYHNFQTQGEATKSGPSPGDGHKQASMSHLPPPNLLVTTYSNLPSSTLPLRPSRSPESKFASSLMA